LRRVLSVKSAHPKALKKAGQFLVASLTEDEDEEV